MYKTVLVIALCFGLISLVYAKIDIIKPDAKSINGSSISRPDIGSPKSPDVTIISQNFEGGVMPPTGWTQHIQNASYTWQISTSYYHSGTYGAVSPWDYNLDEWLISPVINLSSYPTGTPIFLSFWWEGSYYWYVSPNNNGTFSVDVTTNGTDWTTIWDEETTYAWSNWIWYDANFGNHLDLSAYAGQTSFQFRFRNLANDNADVGLDDILLYANLVFANDVGVDAILAPGASAQTGSPFTPSGSIKNYGSATQPNFPVVCSIVGAGGAFRYTNTQTVTSLVAGASTTVNFTPYTPTIQEALTIIMRTNLTGDENPANDRKTSTCNIGNWFLQEAFNGTFPPTGWQANIINGTYNWEGATSGTYPTCTPYEGAGMTTYKSYNATSGSTARLISPAISLGSTTVGCTLSFFMVHDPGYSSNADKIGVEYSTDGTTFTPVAEFLRYAATQEWTEHKVFLGNFSGTIYVGFLATSAYGNNMYMDYVTLYGGQGTPPPQKDVGVAAIIAPGAIHTSGALMSPIAKIKNYGAAAQSGFAVVCSMLGTGGALRYTNTKTAGSVAAGDTARINFDPWTPTIGEQLTVIMRTNLAQDSNPANDRMTRTTLVSTYLLMEGFNDATFPPPGWDTVGIISTNTYNQWSRQTSGTYPTCTPIEGTAMARYYSLLASNGSQSRLFSPPINLGSSAQPCSVKFYMTHDPGYASSDDNIKVQYSTDGTNYIDVATFSRYATAFAWTEHSVYLGSFSGTIRVGFLATGAYGNNMFIDDVRVIGSGVGIEEEKPNKLPTITSLNAPKPNPVKNGIAHISFNIAEPTKASLKIYDASGKLIKTLVNSMMNTGTYNLNWNGTDDDNNKVSDGIYFYTLETSSKNFTKKLVLTR